MCLILCFFFLFFLGGGDSMDLLATGTVACQAPLSMEFSRQEQWSGLPFFSPGNLPN